MKKLALLLVASLPLFWACNSNDETSAQQGENDIDAARMFIRSALDGKWKDARRLIVQDPVNVEDLETAERMADRRDALTQRNYREAQITIHDTRKVGDSVSIVTYSNTFKKQKDSVKVVRVGSQWLVDLKYSFPNTNAVQQ
ncbi:MAG: hypothetical protein EOO10_05005 [Chitinophagaceae bacterium]|nr:MAG: hypothetical protein EOO10_05005 [Chitinophagaceae bacterium]